MRMDSEIRAITETIKNAVDCEKIYLFGSYAYGEPHKDSDLDFYVVVPDDAIKPLDAMQRIYGELAKTKMNVPVDILAAYSSQFTQRSAELTLENKVAKEGMVLFERDGHHLQMA